MEDVERDDPGAGRDPHNDPGDVRAVAVVIALARLVAAKSWAINDLARSGGRIQPSAVEPLGEVVDPRVDHRDRDACRRDTAQRPLGGWLISGKLWSSSRRRSPTRTIEMTPGRVSASCASSTEAKRTSCTPRWRKVAYHVERPGLPLDVGKCCPSEIEQVSVVAAKSAAFRGERGLHRPIVKGDKRLDRAAFGERCQHRRIELRRDGAPDGRVVPFGDVGRTRYRETRGGRQASTSR
ncbi:MAG: hypothetical protein KatS3mg060_0651 [Dehalococcoidia bacterium]|nr:MAG: hypothetical protein KatS3mg060_0651 [Dehalococcoidia bacterium]